MTLLSIDDLRVDFTTLAGRVHAVRGVSLDVAAGDAVAIVGESGSGKSVMGRAIMGLLEENAQATGTVTFDGVELLGATDATLREVRGIGIGMVFQDSLDSLNPVYPIGAQLVEELRVRGRLSRRDARARALELLERVGIRDAAARFGHYPHQFSGGMRQRVCIALAIALSPRLLIADEPTTALDVTVQAGILRLLADLQRERGMALLFVTHDLAVARLVANRIVVMRGGVVVEQGDMHSVFARPQHPYTRALFAAHPAGARSWRDLAVIPETIGGPPEPEPIARASEAMIHES